MTNKTLHMSGRKPAAEPHRFPHLDAGPDWMTDPDLVCALPENRDLFHSPLDTEQHSSRALCRDCPFRVRCLTHALETEEVHGIWGGVLMSSKDERDRAKKALRVTVKPKPAPKPAVPQRQRRADEQLAAIRALWGQDRSDAEIGLTVGLHPSTVAYTRKHVLGLPSKFGPGGKRLKEAAA